MAGKVFIENLIRSYLGIFNRTVTNDMVSLYTESIIDFDISVIKDCISDWDKRTWDDKFRSFPSPGQLYNLCKILTDKNNDVPQINTNPVQDKEFSWDDDCWYYIYRDPITHREVNREKIIVFPDDFNYMAVQFIRTRGRLTINEIDTRSKKVLNSTDFLVNKKIS